jgi:hypothetical protein
MKLPAILFARSIVGFGGELRKVLLLALCFQIIAGYALADPCLLIYPLDQTVFRYDAARYVLITEGEPGYNHSYAVSGNVLWDVHNDRIASEVYQAPELQGFLESYERRNEFYINRMSATIVIDGFYHLPRQLNDIYLRFLPYPRDAYTQIYINGRLMTERSYRISHLLVATPTDGGFYSDTVVLDIEWNGAKSILISAYSDKNGNRAFDGEPCFNVLLEDPTVPVSETTWGHIKSLYRE